MAYSTTVPLTTIFTPPASCSSSWTYEAEYFNSIPGGLLIQNALTGYEDTQCFPPSFQGIGRAPSTVQVYSPAACPAGYATAGAFSFASTTTALCCQSDFSYVSTFSSINFFSTSAPFDGCISTYLADAGMTTVLGRDGAGPPNTTSVSGPVTMWGQPITIEFQQKDLSLFTTSPSTFSISTSSQKPTSTAISMSASPSSTLAGSRAAQTAAPTTAVQQTSGKSSLSNGAIACISIVGAAVIGVLLGLAVLFRRKRLHTSATSTVQEKGGLPGAALHKQWVRGELDGTELQRDGPHEIRSHDQAKQFHHSDNLVELG